MSLTSTISIIFSLLLFVFDYFSVPTSCIGSENLSGFFHQPLWSALFLSHAAWPMKLDSWKSLSWLSIPFLWLPNTFHNLWNTPYAFCSLILISFVPPPFLSSVGFFPYKLLDIFHFFCQALYNECVETSILVFPSKDSSMSRAVREELNSDGGKTLKVLEG